jgi:hypothetical protein
MSRAAVKPACRSARTFCTAISIELSVLDAGPRVLNMCVCASIKPGRTVAWLKSIAATPDGIFTSASGPTSVMRSPEISTTCLVNRRPALLSNKRPARIAIVWAAGGH